MENTLADLNVVVDRKTWYRGKGGYSSKLLSLTDKMCCLGFAAIADGAKPENIRNISSPHAIRIRQTIRHAIRITPNILSRCLIYGMNNNTTTKLMTINDDENINDSERETKLIEIGKEIGINFSFVG